MRAILKEALKRKGPEEAPSSLSSRDDMTRRQRNLLQWIDRKGALEVGQRPPRPLDRIEEPELPASMTLQYEPHVMSQYYSVYEQREALNGPVIKQLVERLDKAGLYDWVTSNTTAKDVIRLARWSLLGEHQDWALDPHTGSAVRALDFGDIVREHGAPDFWQMEIGWAHGTPWWDVIRHITARALKANLYHDMIFERSDQMSEQISYKGELTEDVIDNMAEMGFGVESTKDITTDQSLNAEMIQSRLMENRMLAEGILQEDWMQPWWKDAMVQMNNIPEKPWRECVADAVKSTPILVVHQHMGDLKDLFIRIGRYKKAYKVAGLDVSDTPAMMDEAETDQAMTWIHWGRNDDTLEGDLEGMWQACSGHSIVIGTQSRFIKDGEIYEDDDLFLYPVRLSLQRDISEWLRNLYQYLHPKK